MEFVKRYWKIALMSLCLLLVLVLLCQFITWRNSARYARFDYANGVARHDSSICDKYWDFEKVVDNNISNSFGDINNGFEGLAFAMVANMRPMLIANFEKEVKEVIEDEDDDDSPKQNIFIRFLNSYTNKVSNCATKLNKINKNKENFYVCSFDGSGCTLFTWEKVDKKWKITKFETDIPIKKVFD